MMSFRNFPNTVFHRSMKYLDVDATVIKKFKEKKESMDALDRNLEKGIPTGVQVGVFNLTFSPLNTGSIITCITWSYSGKRAITITSVIQ